MSALVFYIGAVIVGGFLLMAVVAAALIIGGNYIRQRALRRLIGLRRAP